MSNKYIFIVDTDAYAGNFERDMCAYITGVTGDCEVGDDFAALYTKETGQEESIFAEYLEQRADDHGCCRPTQCWPTKGWLSVGHDKAVREEDWDQKVADKAWQKGQAVIYRGYLEGTKRAEVGKNGWTEENKAAQIARQQEEVDRALKEKSPKYAPHNSVAIFFEEKPTEEMIALMKERAAKFVAAKRKIGASYEKNFKLKIHGFRLVKEMTKSYEEEV